MSEDGVSKSQSLFREEALAHQSKRLFGTIIQYKALPRTILLFPLLVITVMVTWVVAGSYHPAVVALVESRSHGTLVVSVPLTAGKWLYIGEHVQIQAPTKAEAIIDNVKSVKCEVYADCSRVKLMLSENTAMEDLDPIGILTLPAVRIMDRI